MHLYATYSLVAIDADTGEVGSVAASRVLAVGRGIACFDEVGVVNTQHFASPDLAARVIREFHIRRNLDEALHNALELDANPAKRQILAITTDGQQSAYTGVECNEHAKHVIGKHCVGGGNTLTGGEVIDVMVGEFEASTSLSFPRRLLRALNAAMEAGGDRRGKQSAMLKVVCPASFKDWYKCPDLRVDDHPEPIGELKRLLDLFEQSSDAGWC